MGTYTVHVKHRGNSFKSKVKAKNEADAKRRVKAKLDSDFKNQEGVYG